MFTIELKRFPAGLAVCLLLSCVSVALSQTQTTGALQGKVYDRDGLAGIAGAAVTLTNTETGLRRSTVTNADGTYFVATLPPGRYNVSAEAQGYIADPGDPQTSLRDFPIRLSQTAMVQLPPIALRRTGTVTSPSVTPASPGTANDSSDEQLVNTTSATRGINFDRRQLLALPLPGMRSFDTLALLAPGVAEPPLVIGSTVGPGIGPGVGTAGQFTVNGLRSRSNNFTVDGSDNNDGDVGVRRQGFTALVPQPLESVQEFQLSTLLAEPQFGRNLGAQVNAVSRSGGQRYYGTAFGFFTHDKMNARNFFDLTGGPSNFPLTRATDGTAILFDGKPLAPANPVGGKDPLRRLQYGLVLGGPVAPNLHFFGSFEKREQRARKESNFSVPTIAQRGFLDDGASGGLRFGEEDAYFSLFPFPNNPRGPYGANTYTQSLPADARATIFSGRLDRTNFKIFNRESNLAGRYNFTEDNTVLPTTGGALFSTLRASTRTQNVALSLDTALSPRASNQLRVSYGRSRIDFAEIRDPFLRPSTLFPDTPFLLNVPLIRNRTGTTGPVTLLNTGLTTELGGRDRSCFAFSYFFGECTGPLGQVMVSGYSPLGVDAYNFPQGRKDNTYQIANTLIYGSQRHRLSLGVDIRRTQVSSFVDRLARPFISFNDSLDLINGVRNARPQLPNLILGRDLMALTAPNAFLQSLALKPNTSIDLRFSQFDFFFGDQWRLRPNLSLTFGARYQLTSVPIDNDRRIESTFNSRAVQDFIIFERRSFGRSGLEKFLAQRDKIYKQDNNNIAPYLAFAWDPLRNGRTAIRGGFGFYYDQILGSVVSQSRNVYPNFLPINTAGVQIGLVLPPMIAQFQPLLGTSHPSVFVRPGTLNTFDRSRLFSFIDVLRSAVSQNVFGANFIGATPFAPAFVLPSINLETPYAAHWNLAIEREVGHDSVLSLAYVGTRGVHLLRSSSPNGGPNGIPQLDRRAFGGYSMLAPPGRAFPLLGSFTSIDSDATSSYHAVQAELRRRYSNGLQFSAAYTYSHAIDDVSDIFDLAGARALPQNSQNLRAEHASANFDVRQRFTYGVNWDVPLWRRHKWLGGWELASIGTVATGQPYTLYTGVDANLDGNDTDRPNNLAGIQLINQGPVRFTAPANFTGLLAPAGRDGVIGRNTFRTSGLINFDVALTKRFAFSEHYGLELRTEVFNLFNRAHFGAPINYLNFPGVGSSVDLRQPARTIQFGARINFSVPSRVGLASDASAPSTRRSTEQTALFTPIRIIPYSSSVMFRQVSWVQTQTTGALQGKVYDQASLNPIADAVVILTNAETGLRRSTVTDTDGTYFVATLPPGRYNVTAEAQGYTADPGDPQASLRDFPIRLSKTEIVRLPPIALRRVGAVPRTPPGTQVAGTASTSEEQLVNTTTATRGANFDRRQLLALPLPGMRSFDTLALLAPGVADPPQTIGSIVGPGIGPGVGTSGQFAVNGLRSRANNFTVDGSDNNDGDVGVRRQGFTALVAQPIESLEEFQLATLLAEPQYGRNLGAQVNAVSRAGGQQWHGTVFGFFTNDKLSSRNFFDLTGGPASFTISRTTDLVPTLNPRAGLRVSRLTPSVIGRPVTVNGQPLILANPVGGEDPFRRAQYGLVFGGPVARKLHFFGSYERREQRARKESNFAVPIVAERGIFNSGETGLELDTGGSFIVVTTPSTPYGDAIFSLFPFPNNPRGPYGVNTYTANLPADARATIFSGRLDRPNFKLFNRPSNLAGRYNFTDENTTLPATGGALFSSMRALVRTQNVALTLDSAISLGSANQLRLSYGRSSINFDEMRDAFLRPSTLFSNVPFLLNAPLLTNNNASSFSSGFIAAGPGTESVTGQCIRNELSPQPANCRGALGQVIVSGYSPIGVDAYNFPQGRTTNTFQVADTLIRSGRKHKWVMGFDTRRSQANSFLDRLFRPQLSFTSAVDFSRDQISETGSVPGFLLGRDFVAAGAPTGFFQTLALQPDSSIGLRYWQHDFFISDQIRLRPNLTLTLGAKHQLNTVPVEADRKIESTFGSIEIEDFIAFEKELYQNSGFGQFLNGRRKIYQPDKNNLGPYVAVAWDPFGNGKTSVRAGGGIYYDQILSSVVSQARNVFPNFLPLNTAGSDVSLLQSGLFGPTVFPSLNASHPATFALPGTLNTYTGESFAFLLRTIRNNSARFGLSPTGPGFVLPADDLETPYAAQWSLTGEVEIGHDSLFSLAYVGTRGVHLLRFNTPNGGPNASPRVDSIAGPGFFSSSTTFSGSMTTRRPFPLLGSFTSIESNATSSYHALQAEFRRRYVSGLEFNAAYTYSHAIDEVSDIFDLAGARALPQNRQNFRAERASASFDVRHRFAYGASWDLPLWRGRKLLGGWKLASIGAVQSGQPYTLLAGIDVNVDGNLTDRINTTTGITQVNSGPVSLTLPANFTSLLARVGRDGAVGRNTFRAAPFVNFDAAVTKRFEFSEQRSFELRTEIFNVFNRAHFGVPINQLDFPGAGRASETRAPARLIQFGAKLNF